MGSNEIATATTGGPRVVAYLTLTGCYRAQIIYFFRIQINSRTPSGIGLGSGSRLHRMRRSLGPSESSGSKSLAGAKARGAAPAPRRRVPRRHLAFTPRARRRSRMRSMVTTAVSQTVEEEASLLEKDYHTPPRPNASSRSSRNVPELCTYEPPSTTWTPPLALSSATFVASS